MKGRNSSLGYITRDIQYSVHEAGVDRILADLFLGNRVLLLPIRSAAAAFYTASEY